MVSSSAALKVNSPAAAFMAACAGDLAPGMATGSDGWEIT